MKQVNQMLGGNSFARFDYGYDATNPLSGSSSADRTVSYNYDATGNRTAVNDSVNGNASYTANSLNQYSNVGENSYVYDGNGNLFIGNGFYFYDAQNRLIYGQEGSNIDEFGYDSKNRVAIRVVNGTLIYFVYDGWDLIEERNSSGTVLATYVHGARVDEMLTRTTTSGTVYYHHNALGSVTDLTNSSGTVVEKYKYDAFGKPSITDGSGNPLTASAYGNRFLFTGREYLAEVNLYDYRNRVYSADLGRFLQTDPMSFSAGDVNIYRYVGNDCINATDPNGDFLQIVAGAVIGGLVGGLISEANGGSFWAGAAAGAVGGAVVAATFNPALGLAAAAGIDGLLGASVAGAASGIAGSVAKDLTSDLLGNYVCPKTMVEDAAMEAILGLLLGPLAAVADATPIGTPAGNLANVGTYALTVVDSALGGVPNTLSGGSNQN